MEIFSAFLALCDGNPPVIGRFLSQSPVTRSFDVFFHVRLKKRLSKQSICRWYDTLWSSLWHHCYDLGMLTISVIYCSNTLFWLHHVSKHIQRWELVITRCNIARYCPYIGKRSDFKLTTTHQWLGLSVSIVKSLKEIDSVITATLCTYISTCDINILINLITE